MLVVIKLKGEAAYQYCDLLTAFDFVLDEAAREIVVYKHGSCLGALDTIIGIAEEELYSYLNTYFQNK